MAVPGTNRSAAVVAVAGASAGNGAAMAVLSTVFFMWGFVTVLNDILVPHLKGIFALNYAQSMLIQFTFFSAYLLMSLPAARVIGRFGYQRTIVLGLVVMAAGALLFVPAALVASYALFLAALYVLAAGMTFLQVSANPYVVVLGLPEGASSRLNLVQALNSLGTTIGPAVGGLLILSSDSGAESVIRPYVGIAVLLLVLAMVLARFRLPVLAHIEDHTHAGERIWRHRHLVLGAVGIFTYVGAEVAVGSFLVNYLMQPEIGGLTATAAAQYVSLYWGGAMLGRFAGAAVLPYVRTGTAVAVAASLAMLLVLTSMATDGAAAMWTILCVGLCNSILFPSIFTLGVAELGALTGRGSGLLVAAIVGGAVIPLVQGALADRVGIQHAFILPVLCYLYIVYYGVAGSRPASGRSAT